MIETLLSRALVAQLEVGGRACLVGLVDPESGRGPARWPKSAGCHFRLGAHRKLRSL
jgi:hypothetical protein